MATPEYEISYQQAYDHVCVLVFEAWVGCDVLSDRDNEQRMKPVRDVATRTFTDYEGAVHLDLWSEAELRWLALG